MENTIFQRMISYYKGDPKRIQHFTKVYAYASLIGQLEHMPSRDYEILKIAALVHDIGIKEGERLYNSSSGRYQEELGPDIARELLTDVGCSQNIVERVCYLVGHHHTYSNIDGLDYQILVESDFIVNMFEDYCSKEAVTTAYDRIFKTTSGRKIYSEMFDC